MVVVPGAGRADTPPATPLAIPIEPMAGVLLDHVPPATEWVSVVVFPSHTELEPMIDAAAAVTVTVSVDRQPALNAYVTVVVPPVRPVSTPPVEIVPTAGLLLDHVPPVLGDV